MPVRKHPPTGGGCRGTCRLVLRLARAVFLEIRPWTGDIVDARYDPRTKRPAAIYGEPQRRAQCP